MKKTKLILAIALIAGGSLLYSACQKGNTILNPQNNDNSTSKSASDEAFMDHQLTFVDGLAQRVILPHVNTQDLTALIRCGTVTYDTTGATKTATINFGSTPCLTSHEENQYRQGILVITWTGNILDPGTVETITTQNYFVGDAPDAMKQLDFTRTITNMGTNANGNLHFAIMVANAILRFKSGVEITWNANRDREWVQANPATTDDDFFLITGSSA